MTKMLQYSLEVHVYGQFQNMSKASAGVILEGDLGEIVSLSWLISPYLELREK